MDKYEGMKENTNTLKKLNHNSTLYKLIEYNWRNILKPFIPREYYKLLTQIIMMT